MQPGQIVPDFSLKATNGQTVSLQEAVSQYRAVAIHFFPLAFTGG